MALPDQGLLIPLDKKVDPFLNKFYAKKNNSNSLTKTIEKNSGNEAKMYYLAKQPICSKVRVQVLHMLLSQLWAFQQQYQNTEDLKLDHDKSTKMQPKIPADKIVAVE